MNVVVEPAVPFKVNLFSRFSTVATEKSAQIQSHNLLTGSQNVNEYSHDC